MILICMAIHWHSDSPCLQHQFVDQFWKSPFLFKRLSVWCQAQNSSLSAPESAS